MQTPAHTSLAIQPATSAKRRAGRPRRRFAPAIDDTQAIDNFGRPMVDAEGNPNMAPGFRSICGLQLTREELAAFYRVDMATITNLLQRPAYRKAYEHGINFGKISLRRLQWRIAQGDPAHGIAPNATMAIHLSKHWLGEHDQALLNIDATVKLTADLSGAHERVGVRIRRLAEQRRQQLLDEAAALEELAAERTIDEDGNDLDADVEIDLDALPVAGAAE